MKLCERYKLAMKMKGERMALHTCSILNKFRVSCLIINVVVVIIIFYYYYCQSLYYYYCTHRYKYRNLYLTRAFAQYFVKQAKQELILSMKTFIKQKILKAGQAIAMYTRPVIQSSHVIIVYG